MDIKKHWPLIVIAVIVAALVYYFGFSKSDENNEQKSSDEVDNSIALGTNLSAKNPFVLEVEKIDPMTVSVYAQGNGNSYTTDFVRPAVEMNYNSNGQYKEILVVDSADNDMRLVILDYQYFAYGQIDDHTTHFLLFRTKNYTGKNGVYETTIPDEYTIANSIKAASMNWLTSKVTVTKS